MKRLNILMLGLIVAFFTFCKKENLNTEKDPQKPVQTGGGGKYSEVFTGGQFHLGPVDWAETQFTNSNGPYPKLIQQIEGDYLAGLELEHNGNGQLCDACVKIETAKGKSVIVRVVTTGVTSKNSIDLSPEAYNMLNSGEYPRVMTWYITKCPDNGENIYYQFQTEVSEWWTSLWVRNPALPIASVEVKSAKYKNWFKLTRGNDGTYTASGGFGKGAFTLRLTSIDGQVIEDTYASFSQGALLRSKGQFK